MAWCSDFFHLVASPSQYISVLTSAGEGHMRGFCSTGETLQHRDNSLLSSKDQNFLKRKFYFLVCLERGASEMGESYKHPHTGPKCTTLWLSTFSALQNLPRIWTVMFRKSSKTWSFSHSHPFRIHMTSISKGKAFLLCSTSHQARFLWSLPWFFSDIL